MLSSNFILPAGSPMIASEHHRRPTSDRASQKRPGRRSASSQRLRCHLLNSQTVDTGGIRTPLRLGSRKIGFWAWLLSNELALLVCSRQSLQRFDLFGRARIVGVHGQSSLLNKGLTQVRIACLRYAFRETRHVGFSRKRKVGRDVLGRGRDVLKLCGCIMSGI
jgi:hypothetical protein